MTSHSPVAVRELDASQLYVLRQQNERHYACPVGASPGVQGTVRKFPEALLATSVLVCEGASEVGLIRGFDQWRVANGQPSLTACGCALVDGGGNELFSRALTVQSLGYRVAILRDSDVHPTPELEAQFIASGGQTFRWREGRALEDELFLSVGSQTAQKLLEFAVAAKEESLVSEHIKSASRNTRDLATIMAEFPNGVSPVSREILGKASRFKGAKGWFKSVGLMEEVARDVLAPELPQAIDPTFGQFITETIFAWIANGAR